MAQDNQNTKPAIVRPVSLAELNEELLWPRLFRVVPLSLRVNRVLLGMFTLVLIGLLGRAFSAIVDHPSMHVEGSFPQRAAAVVGAVEEGRLGAAGLGFIEMALGVPAPVVRDHPWWAALFAVPLALILAVGGGAISRLAACEFSHSVLIPWPRALGFSISRWWSLTVGLVGPPTVAAAFCGAIALGGVLLRAPALDVLGAIAFPVAMILALLAVLLLFGFAVGCPLVIPAIACEGTDAIDASQRMYAYVVGRPIRLALYGFILGIQLAVLVAIVGAIAVGLRELAITAAGTFAGESGRAILEGSTAAGEALSGTAKIASKIIAFWLVIPTLILGGVVMSYVFCGSTVWYLLVRKLNDGQDPSEIWMPGMVAGTLAPVDVKAGSEAGPGGDFDDE